MTTAQPRISCEVPGCRRTRVPDARWPADRQWFLCAKHWALVSRNTRRVLLRYRRQQLKYDQHLRPAGYHRIMRRAFREAGVHD